MDEQYLSTPSSRDKGVTPKVLVIRDVSAWVRDVGLGDLSTSIQRIGELIGSTGIRERLL